MMKIVLVLSGGSLGALLRYGASLLAARLFGAGFPWGTLIVNLSGCFLIGLSFSMAERGSNLMSPSARLFFATGFLGALTTFSTFALESVNPVRAGANLTALLNFLSNNILGSILVILGIWTGRLK